jgi:hypothetical protein
VSFGQPQANNKLFGRVGHGGDAHHALAAPEADVVWNGTLHRAVAEVAPKPLLHLQAAQVTVFAVAILVATVQRLVPADGLLRKWQRDDRAHDAQVLLLAQRRLVSPVR